MRAVLQLKTKIDEVIVVRWTDGHQYYNNLFNDTCSTDWKRCLYTSNRSYYNHYIDVKFYNIIIIFIMTLNKSTKVTDPPDFAQTVQNSPH